MGFETMDGGINYMGGWNRDDVRPGTYLHIEGVVT